MRKILMLFTGGTIASVKTEAGLEPVLNAEQILSYLPELTRIFVWIRWKSVMWTVPI